ncbi:MAG: nucleoside-diphosphate kinase [Planctomycetota bacterium]
MVDRTLVILKPDAVQRHLMGHIISRFELKGLKLIAAKFMQIAPDTAREHYVVHSRKDFYNDAVRYLSSAPVLVMVWQGSRAIEITRKMMGATFGFQAEPGTIRGDLCISHRCNLIHGSDSPENAEKEISLYFTRDELLDYDLSDSEWMSGPDC